LTLQQFKVIQGHRSWCQSKAHIRLLVIDSKFGRICYRFRGRQSYKMVDFSYSTLV